MSTSQEFYSSQTDIHRVYPIWIERHLWKPEILPGEESRHNVLRNRRPSVLSLDEVMTLQRGPRIVPVHFPLQRSKPVLSRKPFSDNEEECETNRAWSNQINICSPENHSLRQEARNKRQALHRLDLE